MHDEPTTMGGDHDWEKRERERINLKRASPPMWNEPPPKEWYERYIGAFIMIGVLVIWYWIIKGLIGLWGWVHG
jgi:hypothetical protein